MEIELKSNLLSRSIRTHDRNTGIQTHIDIDSVQDGFFGVITKTNFGKLETGW